jgi:hypothetical protein
MAQKLRSTAAHRCCKEATTRSLIITNMIAALSTKYEQRHSGGWDGAAG